MIKYKKKITLQNVRDNAWFLDTDRGDRYETFAIDNTKTPWTQWWSMQDQSDLRLWQKDILRDFGTKWRDLTPYVVYKKNSGYNQPHDISLARSEKNLVWILITRDDFWFVSSNYGQVDFDSDDSMGSLLDKQSRAEISKLRDLLVYD